MKSLVLLLNFLIPCECVQPRIHFFNFLFYIFYFQDFQLVTLYKSFLTPVFCDLLFLLQVLLLHLSHWWFVSILSHFQNCFSVLVLSIVHLYLHFWYFGSLSHTRIAQYILKCSFVGFSVKYLILLCTFLSALCAHALCRAIFHHSTSHSWGLGSRTRCHSGHGDIESMYSRNDDRVVSVSSSLLHTQVHIGHNPREQ